MAAGNVLVTTVPEGPYTPEQMVTDLNAFFVANDRMRIYSHQVNVAKSDTQDVNSIVVRLLYEVTDALPSKAGFTYLATSFQGEIDDVVSAYEAFFVSTLVPKIVMDITAFDSIQSSELRLVVIYIDTNDNPGEGHGPNQLLLARTTGVIAAGATGTIEYLDSSGSVIGTGTARNVSVATASTTDEVIYAIMDKNSNEVLFLPSCCGVP